MPTSAVLLGYQERIFSLHTAASQLRTGQMIAMVIMIAAFLAMGVLAFLAIVKRSVPLPSALVPLPLAIYAGRATRRRNTALLQTLRLETFYQCGVERLEGRWAGTGTRGEEFATPDNLYAQDLSVFGDGSLFELLCTCRTDVGRRHLARSFVAAPLIEDVRRRQEAVKELRHNVELREQLHLLGEYSFQQSSWNTIMEWLESPVAQTPAWFRVAAFALSIAMAVFALLSITNLVALSQLAIPMCGVLGVSGALALRYRDSLLAAQPAIRALSLELGVLRQGLALLQSQKFGSPLLSELAESAKQSDAAARIRRLERLANALRERDKEWFYHASRALLIGTQVFLAIETWRSLHGKAMRRWLAAWGEFEALMAIANYASEHPENAFPSFAESGTTLECEAAGHPLLPSDVSVRNDIAWNERTRFYVISGSNMSGKSTLLRTIGLNVVLAYAGAPVCATRMTLSRLAICASISIQDSLLNGKSKFMAEVDRLKEALSVAPSDGPVLFLIDEILSGTNSKDRRTAAEAILRAPLERGAIGALSTHDLALTELAELSDLAGVNVHMGSKDDSNPLDFDYVIKPGVINQSSALAIARLAGVSV